MSTLAEALAGQAIRAQVVNVGTVAGFLRQGSAEHLASVVADWLTSDEVVEVVARALRSEERNASMSEVDWGEWEDAGEEERGAYRHLAREQLAALAAHAKGEDTP